MSVVSARLGFASALAVLFFAGAVHAQSVPYWTSAWPGGFGSLTSDPGANGFGNFSSRYNFENGWFVGSERGNLGFGANGFSPVSAFGSSAFTYEGAQAGYNFKSVPVSIYAGFDTLKYDTGGTGNSLLAFDSMSSSNSPGYSVRAGVEFRPTSNLSLSFGASFTQQPTDINSALLPGASPLAFGRR